MRYKVKVTSPEAYRRVQEMVSQSDTRVFVVSDRRMVLSIGEISSSLRSKIEQLGAQVQPDYQYSSDDAVAF
jgi:hypothetical protein